MAKPIKETPVLTGKDAVRFSERLAKVEKQKASESEFLKVMNNYNKIRKQSAF